MVMLFKRNARGGVKRKAFRNRWNMNKIFHTYYHQTINGSILFYLLKVLDVDTNTLYPAIF